MDRAWENLLIRTFGALSVAALLVHAGLDVPARSLQWLYLTPFFLGAVVANWALARLNVKRAALWVTVVLLGVLPIVMPLFHRDVLGQVAVYDNVLYVGVVTGLATLVVGSMALVSRGRNAGIPSDE